MVRSVVCAVAFSLAAAASADDSIRCGGAIVSVGDSKVDLVGKCGWPAFREEQLGERTAVLRDGGGGLAWASSATARIERWTYDFGPSRFVSFVVMELGKIVRIERGGYGYASAAAEDRPAIPRARCQTTFREGERTYDVLARCGEPAFREVRTDVRTRVLGDERGPIAQAESVTVVLEVWTYDFGPSSFVRHLTFEDGTLVRIDTGSYGYAR